MKIQLRKAIENLVRKCPEIEEVWLFGSLARGDAVPGSDADLLFILSESTIPFLERFVYYQPEPIGVGVDLLAYTRKEIEKMEAEGNPFVKNATSGGICLFQRSSFR